MKKILSNPWEIENKFYLNSDPSRLKKIICHYEIFKKTANISGSIVECGVFKGNSLIRFITFRDMLSNNKKKVVGHAQDTFPNIQKHLQLFLFTD